MVERYYYEICTAIEEDNEKLYEDINEYKLILKVMRAILVELSYY